jgi:outer membrane receptor protein involved in Fe transport
MVSRALAVLLGLVLTMGSAYAATGPDAQLAAQQAVGAAAQASAQQQATPQPPAKPPETEKKEEKREEAPRYEEQVVVTASKVEQQLINAPATVSVISAQTLASKPAQDYAGLFRAVPGVNVTQTSARDINITSRGATGTLSTTQLALIDGRSVYLDFFGFIGWDFLPINFREIKQIEVIRGPASAVWGANAMTGVVNIITRAPGTGASWPSIATRFTGGGLSNAWPGPVPWFAKRMAPRRAQPSPRRWSLRRPTPAARRALRDGPACRRTTR